jgi:hypothetical protein
MGQIMYELTKLLPYFIIFPVLAFILYIGAFILSRKKLTNENASFYGLFMNLRTVDMVSLSLLFIHYFLIIESIFVTENSIYMFILLFLPMITFNILNFNLIRVIPSLLNSLLIYVLLFFKTIFYSYIIEIQPAWYVIILFIVLCAFVVLYSTYVSLTDLLTVLKHDEFVKKKIKGAKKK